VGDGACPGGKWPSNYYSYFVNLGSFATSLWGITLTTDQARYLAQYSVNQWRERTGIQDGLTLNYGTTTTTQTLCSTNVANHQNDVLAVSGCADVLGDTPPCNTMGLTRPRCIDWPSCASLLLEEVDVCLYGAAARPQPPPPDNSPWGECTGGWKMSMSSLVPGQNGVDLLRVLSHEFGHALGLGHNTVAATSLMGTDVPCGEGRIRNPFGDDIEGLRAVYPASSADVARWREMTSTSWSTETSVAPVDGVWDALAAVGRSGSGEKVIVSEVSDGGTIIGFNRATYPLTATSTWDAIYTNAHTWRPVAIAARPLSDPAGELWVAALSLEQQRSSDCPGIRVFRSTNAFTSFTSVDLVSAGQCGSQHEPAVAYDKGRGRFIVAYALSDGVILTRTSTDGTSWTTGQALNVGGNYLRSMEAPSLACANAGSQCLLSYLDGDTLPPALQNRQLIVNGSSPYLSLGSSTSNSAVLQTRPPGAGVRTFGGGNDWFLSASFTYDRDDTIPFSPFTWTVIDNPALIESHRVSFAGVPSSGREYVWYVR
jgi:hypothetical protein